MSAYCCSLGEDLVSTLGAKVESCSLIVWDKRDVHAEEGNVSLGKIVLLFDTLTFFGCNEDRVVTLDFAITFEFGRFVLELLLVLKVVQRTVGTTAHDDLLEFSTLRFLESFELLFGIGAEPVFIQVPLFRSNVDLLVSLFERVVVVGETFAKLVIFLFVIKQGFFQPLKNFVSEDDAEKEEWPRVVSQIKWVGVHHSVLDIVA